MDLSGLKTDSARAEVGDWVKDIPGMGDLQGARHRKYFLSRGRQSPLSRLPRGERNRDGSLKPETLEP